MIHHRAATPLPSTVVDISAAAGNWVRSDSPDTVYHSAYYGSHPLAVQRLNPGGVGDYELRYFLRMPQYLSGKRGVRLIMDSVGLQIACFGPAAEHQDDLSARIYLISADWSPSTLTWNNQPALGAVWAGAHLSADRMPALGVNSTQLAVAWAPIWVAIPDDSTIYGIALVTANVFGTLQATEYTVGWRIYAPVNFGGYGFAGDLRTRQIYSETRIVTPGGR